MTRPRVGMFVVWDGHRMKIDLSFQLLFEDLVDGI